jgi:hypothetical protein
VSLSIHLEASGTYFLSEYLEADTMSRCADSTQLPLNFEERDLFNTLDVAAQHADVDVHFLQSCWTKPAAVAHPHEWAAAKLGGCEQTTVKPPTI